MKPLEARAMLEVALRGAGMVWADIGAGEGTFTRAIFEILGPNARIYALDKDEPALAVTESWARSAGADVITVRADFAGDFELSGLESPGLDGMLLANTLHFVPEPERLLTALSGYVRPGGRVVVIEYDRRRSDRWVPHPIPSASWPTLATAAGLVAPSIAATRPSAYRGSLYTAIAYKSQPGGGGSC